MAAIWPDAHAKGFPKVKSLAHTKGATHTLVHLVLPKATPTGGEGTCYS